MSFHPKMAYGATFHKSSRVLEDEGPVFAYTPENRARFDQIQITQLVRLMLTARQRNQIEFAQRHVRVVIVGRNRLFEPQNPIFGHRFREALHRLLRIAFVAHAPPGVRIHHDLEVRPGRLPDPTHGFEVGFRTASGPHLICRESQIARQHCFGRISFR